MDRIDIDSPGNSDLEKLVDVSQWLVLYPNASFRMHFRLQADSPLIDHQWATPDLGVENSDKLEVLEGQLYIRSAADDITKFNGKSGYYDCRLEDPTTGRKITMFGGSMSFTPYGITL